MYSAKLDPGHTPQFIELAADVLNQVWSVLVVTYAIFNHTFCPESKSTGRSDLSCKCDESKEHVHEIFQTLSLRSQYLESLKSSLQYYSEPKEMISTWYRCVSAKWHADYSGKSRNWSKPCLCPQKLAIVQPNRSTLLHVASTVNSSSQQSIKYPSEPLVKYYER